MVSKYYKIFAVGGAVMLIITISLKHQDTSVPTSKSLATSKLFQKESDRKFSDRVVTTVGDVENSDGASLTEKNKIGKCEVKIVGIDETDKKSKKKKDTKKKKAVKAVKAVEQTEEETAFDDLEFDNEDVALLPSYGGILHDYKKMAKEATGAKTNSDPLAKNNSLRNDRPIVAKESGYGMKFIKNLSEIFVGEQTKLTYSLEIMKDNKRVVADAIVAEVYNPSGVKERVLQFDRDENKIYSSVYDVSGSADTEFGRYLVKLSVDVGNVTIDKIDTFSLDIRLAKFQNSVKASITADADLQLRPKFKVYRYGNYLVQASLYDSAGTFIAYQEVVAKMDARNSSPNIVYPGKIFHDNKIDGPYVLKNLSISYVDSNLKITRQEQVKPLFKTEKYSWNEFRSSAVSNEVISNKIEQFKQFLSQL